MMNGSRLIVDLKINQGMVTNILVTQKFSYPMNNDKGSVVMIRNEQGMVTKFW